MPVGTATPGTTGRIRLDGIFPELAIETLAVCFGVVRLNDHTGWVPLGAEIVTRIRVPAR
jgi:hypothetical protein